MKTKTKIQTKKSTAVSAVSIEGHPVPASSPSKVLGGLLSFSKGEIVKTQKYYTLVGLNTDHVDIGWEIIFGDYDREVVEDERDDIKDNQENGVFHDIAKFKIITTSDKQADIEFAVKRLNEKNSSEELLLSEKFYKVKPLEKTDPVQQNYLVVEVAERHNWSGANNGTTCYTYTKWKQTDDGFVYTHRKGSRKLFDSIEAAFKAGGIGKTIPFYNYLDAPSVGSEKKIISQGWGSDLYCHVRHEQQNEISPSYLRPIFKSPLTSTTER